MQKNRLEALTDGVVAIIITIIVLELKVPEENTLAGLLEAAPVFLVYALSFINVGIFWNNHHHMLHAAEHINGKVLWANLFLLFWLSLIPFVIRWMDERHFASLPTAAYGLVLTASAVGYTLLEYALIGANPQKPILAQTVGIDAKGLISLTAYVSAIFLAFLNPWIAIAIYVSNALYWLIPDRRIERALAEHKP
jgi:uncharacterized membrane protein